METEQRENWSSIHPAFVSLVFLLLLDVELAKPICSSLISEMQSPLITIQSGQRAVVRDAWRCLSLTPAARGILSLAPAVKAGCTLTLAHLKSEGCSKAKLGARMVGSVMRLVSDISYRSFFTPY